MGFFTKHTLETLPQPSCEKTHRVLTREMEEETKVEETVPQTPVVEEIDYDAELKEAQEKAESNRLAYAARKAIKDVEVEPEVDNSDDIADKVIRKILPVINTATQSNLIDRKLEELSGGNESLKRSIKWHMDNSVNPSLDLHERAEAAYAIANRKVISKTLNEINIAQKNRVNIVGIGEGSSTEVQQRPGDNVLSENQMTELKKIAKLSGFSPKQTEDFISKSKQRLAQSK
jgi:hypothetical protein